MSNLINLHGEIGRDITAQQVQQQLALCDQTKPLVVSINSDGGSVFDGLTIYDAFTAYAGPKKAIIESAAFSIASFIAMAFDDCEITENGYLMIHNPYSETVGDDEEHARASALLSKLKDSMVAAYSRKSGKSQGEIQAIMKEQTFFNAQESMAAGFVNRVTTAKKVAMRPAAKYQNLPQRVFASLFSAAPTAETESREPAIGVPKMSDTQAPVAATLAEIKKAFPKAKAEFVISCLERSLPLASVMSDALAAMDAENQGLKAKLAEMEAKAMEMPPEEESEEMAKAQVKRGVKPVAKSTTTTSVDSRVVWNQKIEAKVSQGLARNKAVLAVNRENPGLREKMLEEVNS